MAELVERAGSALIQQLKERPVLLLGLLVTVIPTIITLAAVSWTTEAGVHGPLVLATAGWLVWRSWDDIVADARPGALGLAVPLLVLGCAIYGFSRAYNFLMTEVAGLLLALLAIAYAFVGRRVLARMWFPIFYLGFLIPLPGWAVDSLTQPLKIFVSDAVTWLLATAGYPIAQQGVALYIAQYELLVEDACAGLNSIVSLTAVGLFYIYLVHNASWKYSALLFAFLLPIAVLANVIRVVILVLLTYYAGNDVAQGYLHDFAGIVTFVSALALVFLLDSALTPLRNWFGRKGLSK